MFGNVYVLDYTKANNAKVLIIKRYGNKKSKIGFKIFIFLPIVCLAILINKKEKCSLPFGKMKEKRIPLNKSLLDFNFLNSLKYEVFFISSKNSL